MPAPTVTVTPTGSDPKDTTLEILVAAVDAPLEVLHDDIQTKADDTATTDALAGKASTSHTHTADQITETGALKVMTSTERTKLGGIDPSATANDTDGNLKARANHTGTQAISTVTGLQDELDGKASTGHGHVISDVTGLQAAIDDKSDSGHGHTIPNITGLQAAIDGKSATDHGHAIADVTGLQSAIDGKTATGHAHDISDVTGLQAAIDGKSATSHGHAIADVTGLQSAIDGKSATGHVHTISDVTGLQDEIDAKLSSEGFATDKEAIAGLIGDKPVAPSGVLAATNALQRKLDQTINFNLESARVGRAIAPGLSPQLYSKVFEGAAAVMETLSTDDVVSTDEGLAYQIAGEGTVSTSEAFMLYGERKWQITVTLQRAVDSDDPSGDALEATIVWLNSEQTTAGITTEKTILNAGVADVVAADGWVTYTAVIARSDLSGVDHFNTQAKFFRLIVQQYGTGEEPKANVLVQTAVDITGASVVQDVAADIGTRLTAVESRTPFAAQVQPTGTSLNAITAAGVSYVASPTDAPTGAATTLGVTNTSIDTNTLSQEVWDAAGNYAQRFWRMRISGTWGAWQQVATQSYVDTEIAALANSIGPGTSDELIPVLISDSTDLAVTYGAFTDGRYVWSIDNLFTFYGNIQFTPTFTDGNHTISIGGLPASAVTVASVLSCPVIVNPAGNWRHPTGHVATTGTIGASDPDAIKLQYEVTASNDDTRRKNYLLSDLTSGSTYSLSFSGAFLAETI
jgi:hypothetical protein